MNRRDIFNALKVKTKERAQEGDYPKLSSCDFTTDIRVMDPIRGNFLLKGRGMATAYCERGGDINWMDAGWIDPEGEFLRQHYEEFETAMTTARYLANGSGLTKQEMEKAIEEYILPLFNHLPS